MGRGAWWASNVILLQRGFLLRGSDRGDHTFQQLAIFFEMIAAEVEKSDLIEANVLLIHGLEDGDSPFHSLGIGRIGGLEGALLIDFKLAQGAPLLKIETIVG